MTNISKSFSDLRKTRGDFSKIKAAIDKIASGKKSFKDDRFWAVTKDKVGNGSAILRFLPQTSDSSTAWVQTFDHGFKGPNGWYIEKCPTTLGDENHKCPACQANSVLWNSGIESDKEIARNRKRRLRYISNVYILKDYGAPDNEGKVFLFSYGKKIFDKIMNMISPEFAGEEERNIFDMWEGSNFHLKVRKLNGFDNYDSSTFGDVSALLAGDDEKLKKIWESEYDLSEFIGKPLFKPYDELSAKFRRVMSGTTPEEETLPPAGTSHRAVADDDDGDDPVFRKTPYDIPVEEGGVIATQQGISTYTANKIGTMSMEELDALLSQ